MDDSFAIFEIDGSACIGTGAVCIVLPISLLELSIFVRHVLNSKTSMQCTPHPFRVNWNEGGIIITTFGGVTTSTLMSLEKAEKLAALSDQSDDRIKLEFVSI